MLSGVLPVFFQFTIKIINGESMRLRGPILSFAALALLSSTTLGNSVESAAEPVGRCAPAFNLAYSPVAEQAVFNQNGHVNGDGYVCWKEIGKPDNYIVIIDNVIPW